MPSRKDIPLDKIHLPLIHLISPLGHRDDLKHCYPTIVSQISIYTCEERIQIASTNMLDHLNAHNLIILPAPIGRKWHLTVIADKHFNIMLKSILSDALSSKRSLFSARSDSGHTTSRAANSFDGKGAPSRADLEHVIRSFDPRGRDCVL